MSLIFLGIIIPFLLLLFFKNSLGEVSQNDSNEVVRQLTRETKSFYSKNFDETKYLQQNSSDRVQKFVNFYEGIKRQKSRAGKWIKSVFRSGDKDVEQGDKTASRQITVLRPVSDQERSVSRKRSRVYTGRQLENVEIALEAKRKREKAMDERLQTLDEAIMERSEILAEMEDEIRRKNRELRKLDRKRNSRENGESSEGESEKEQLVRVPPRWRTRATSMRPASILKKSAEKQSEKQGLFGKIGSWAAGILPRKKSNIKSSKEIALIPPTKRIPSAPKDENLRKTPTTIRQWPATRFNKGNYRRRSSSYEWKEQKTPQPSMLRRITNTISAVAKAPINATKWLFNNPKKAAAIGVGALGATAAMHGMGGKPDPKSTALAIPRNTSVMPYGNPHEPPTAAQKLFFRSHYPQPNVQYSAFGPRAPSHLANDPAFQKYIEDLHREYPDSPYAHLGQRKMTEKPKNEPKMGRKAGPRKWSIPAGESNMRYNAKTASYVKKEEPRKSTWLPNWFPWGQGAKTQKPSETRANTQKPNVRTKTNAQKTPPNAQRVRTKTASSKTTTKTETNSSSWLPGWLQWNKKAEDPKSAPNQPIKNRHLVTEKPKPVRKDTVKKDEARKPSWRRYDATKATYEEPPKSGWLPSWMTWKGSS